MKALTSLTSCVFLAIFGCYGPVRAAVLSGVVAEEGGEPVAQAEVMLMNPGTRVILRKDFTDSKGAFRFKVKPGIFKIGAFKSTYSSVWTKNVVVRDADVSIDIELEPEVFVERPAPSPDEEDCE